MYILRVLVFSGLFPQGRNESSGSFITRRLAALKNEGVDFEALAVQSYDSLFLKTVRNIMRKGETVRQNDLVSSEKDIVYPFSLYKYESLRKGILDILLKEYGYGRIETLVESAINEQTDLIHAHWVVPHGYVAVRLGMKHRIPVIVSAHGSDIHTNASKSRSSLKRTLFTLENASRVIFVSEALKKAARDLGYSGRNAIVIPNGVDTKMIEQVTELESNQRSSNFKDHAVVGFVGNLVPVKRADRFPAIFKKIAEKTDARFLVVGDGPLREKIQQDCSKYNLRVDFVGRVPQDDVFKYMNLMDVLILPSRNEGWPCVVLEAQACGVPVVGSNNGGIPEAIGNGGSVVQDGENFEERFAKSVVEFLRNPVDSLELRKRAVQFDWSIVVGKEIAVYKEVIPRHDTRA